MDANFFTGSWFRALAAIFLLVLLLLWILLPFAINTMRGSLKETVALNKAILAELKKLNAGVKKIDDDAGVKKIDDGAPITQTCLQCGHINSVEVMECVKCAARMPPL